MSDELWAKTRSGSWMFSHQHPNMWTTDMAEIQCTAPHQWHLFINRQHIGTFSSWEEARDATPMMLKLHGYESQS